MVKENNCKWSEDLIEDVVDGIKVNAIVPVIGDDAYYVEGEDISVQHYLLDRVLKSAILEYEYKAEAYKDGIKGYTRLSHCLLKDRGLILKKLIIKELKKPEINSKIHLRADIKAFLDNGDFPLIISTSIYKILANELVKEYRVVSYQKEQKAPQDISMSDDKICQDTIYNIFGELVTHTDCVFTDSDFLSYLHSLHDTNTCPKHLIRYLESRHVLMLGCDIPDWTFRFLLYSLKAKHGDLRPEQGAGGLNSFVGGSLSKRINKELEIFLSDIQYLSSCQVSEFLSDINQKLQPMRKPKLFLSCLSDEYNSAEVLELRKKLSEKFDVWFCPEQIAERGGEAYWKKIREGLEEADYFMPFVTDRLCFRLSRMDAVDTIDPQPDTPNEKGIVTEWKFAIQYECSNNTRPYILSDIKEFSGLVDEKLKLLKRLFFTVNGAQAIQTPVNLFNPSTDIVIL